MKIKLFLNYYFFGYRDSSSMRYRPGICTTLNKIVHAPLNITCLFTSDKLWIQRTDEKSTPRNGDPACPCQYRSALILVVHFCRHPHVHRILENYSDLILRGSRPGMFFPLIPPPRPMKVGPDSRWSVLPLESWPSIKLAVQLSKDKVRTGG